MCGVGYSCMDRCVLIWVTRTVKPRAARRDTASHARHTHHSIGDLARGASRAPGSIGLAVRIHAAGNTLTGLDRSCIVHQRHHPRAHLDCPEAITFLCSRGHHHLSTCPQGMSRMKPSTRCFLLCLLGNPGSCPTPRRPCTFRRGMPCMLDRQPRCDLILVSERCQPTYTILLGRPKFMGLST